jgi:hypothetical protein
MDQIKKHAYFWNKTGGGVAPLFEDSILRGNVGCPPYADCDQTKDDTFMKRFYFVSCILYPLVYPSYADSLRFKVERL